MFETFFIAFLACFHAQLEKDPLQDWVTPQQTTVAGDQHAKSQVGMRQNAGTACYMTTCACGAHFGDFHLFSKPGGAFFE